MTPRSLVFAVILSGALAETSAAQDRMDLEEPGHDAYWYGQFVSGSIGEGLRYRSMGLAFGYRREREHLALDLRVFSAQIGVRSPDLHTYGGTYTSVFAGSLMTTQLFRVFQPRAPRSVYAGGGVGLSGISFGRSGDVDDEWLGRGIEGRGTVGYAFRRSNTSTRWFLEAGINLPVRPLRRTTRLGAPDGTRRVYPWTVALGVGW